MSPHKKLPLEGLYAYHNKKDNSIRIGSEDNTLNGGEIILDKKDTVSNALRLELQESGCINTTVEGLLDGFKTMGINHASYDSGLVLSKIRKNDSISPLNIPEKYIPLKEHVVRNGIIRIGIDCTDIAILGILGAEGFGKSTFVKNQFPDDISTHVNFSEINYGSMSATQKEDYGNSLSQVFLRDPRSKFLVIDNYATSRRIKNLNFHPTMYYNTFQQITSHAKFFKKAGKTLVICGVDESGLLEKVEADAVIELFGHNVYLNYGFSFGGIDFPRIPVE